MSVVDIRRLSPASLFKYRINLIVYRRVWNNNYLPNSQNMRFIHSLVVWINSAIEICLLRHRAKILPHCNFVSHGQGHLSPIRVTYTLQFI
jgi:hypothetical protein